MKHLFVAIFSAYLLSGCTSAPSEDDLIARVNGVPISVRDYMDLYDSLKPRDTELTAKERPQLRNLVLQTLVRREVILTTAKEKKISVSEEELNKGIEKYKSGYTPQLFNESLLEGMVDEKAWRERIRETLLMQKLFESAKPKIQEPSNEEALNYFQNHPQLFRKDAQATALHLVVAEEKTASELRRKILAGSIDFVAAARENSTGPEAQEDAKIQIEKGTMPEEIDRALFEGPLNTLSPIIKSPYGFHIFKVLSRTPAENQDFLNVKKQIVATLFEEKRAAWMEKFEEGLIRAAEIEYNRSLIERL